MVAPESGSDCPWRAWPLRRSSLTPPPERMPVKPPRSGSSPSAWHCAGVGLQKKMSGGFKMKRSAAIRSAVLSGVLLLGVLLLGVLAAGGASARQAGTDDGLT